MTTKIIHDDPWAKFWISLERKLHAESEFHTEIKKLWTAKNGDSSTFSVFIPSCLSELITQKVLALTDMKV